MKIIISPAKTVKERQGHYGSLPQLLARTEQIRKEVLKKDLYELMEMWGCSEKIAEVNQKRFAEMNLSENLMCAIERYTGMQYQSLDYAFLNETQKAYILKHVLIPDAFYGLLKADDGIVPYRMDFHAQIQINGCKDLYEYWKDLPSSLIEDDLLINLASEEYAKAILPYYSGSVVSIRFMQNKNGKLRSASTLAKKARGTFLRWMAVNSMESLEQMKDFDLDGFHYEKDVSNESCFVFVK